MVVVQKERRDSEAPNEAKLLRSLVFAILRLASRWRERCGKATYCCGVGEASVGEGGREKERRGDICQVGLLLTRWLEEQR